MWDEKRTIVMKNNYKKPILIGVIVLLVFNIISFVLPIPKNLLYWTGYIAMMFCFFVCVFSIYNWVTSNQSLKSKFSSLSILTLSYRYLITQLILSTLLYLVAFYVDFNTLGFEFLPILIVIVIVIINAIFVIKLLFTQIGINVVNEVESKIRTKVNFIQSLQLEINNIITDTTDVSVKAKLKELSEIIRFSDPISSESLEDLENKIHKEIENLKILVKEDENNQVLQIIDSIKDLLSKRNTLVKFNK